MSTGTVERPTTVYTQLIELRDVQSDPRADGDVLEYNATLNCYEHKPGTGAGLTFGALNNVDNGVDALGAPEDGFVATWNNASGEWDAQAVPAGASTLGALTNVDATADTAANNEMLVRVNPGNWTNLNRDTWLPEVQERQYFYAETGPRVSVNSITPASGEIGYAPLATSPIGLTLITNIYVPDLDIDAARDYQFANNDSTNVNDVLCLYAKDATNRTYKAYYRIDTITKTANETNYTVTSLGTPFGSLVAGQLVSLSWHPMSFVTIPTPAEGVLQVFGSAATTALTVNQQWETVQNIVFSAGTGGWVATGNAWEMQWTGVSTAFTLFQDVSCYSPTRVDRVLEHTFAINGTPIGIGFVNYTLNNTSRPESVSAITAPFTVNNNDIVTLVTRYNDTTLPSPTNVVIESARIYFLQR